MSKVSRPRAPSLSLVTASFVAISLLIGAALVFKTIDERVRAFQEAGLRTAVETRARGLQTAFGAALYREWTNLESLTKLVATGDPREVQDDLSTLVGQGRIISWAGFASSDGTVLAASNGLLVGANVAARPWFQRGLQGNYAGDAHEAVLLASKLPPLPNGEPKRFLDLAAPIPGVGGSTVGVIGVHLNLEWARAQIHELAAALKIDVFVVNPEGKVVISSLDGQIPGLDLPSFGRARSAATGVSLETWPDGNRYFSASLPEATYLNLPKFGWSIVARIGADAVSRPANSFSAGLLLNLALYGTMLFLFTSLFIVSFIRPFHHLAVSAKAIADGKDIYPYESRRTSELAVIGSALARLQSKLEADDVENRPSSSPLDDTSNSVTDDR